MALPVHHLRGHVLHSATEGERLLLVHCLLAEAEICQERKVLKMLLCLPCKDSSIVVEPGTPTPEFKPWAIFTHSLEVCGYHCVAIILSLKQTKIQDTYWRLIQ